jgi:carbonic anhydrase/acetyltransferase-like protein (isoleucine patch superfamily)
MNALSALMRRFRRRPPERRERMRQLLDGLRASGMRIGDNVAIYNCTLDTNFPFLIEIGSGTIVTHATILAHDASPVVFGLGVVVAPVRIGSRCFIGAGACIMPGVSVGDGSIVAANAVVTRDVSPGTVVAGNPARPVGDIESWKRRVQVQRGNRALVPSFGDGQVVPTEAQSAELAAFVRQSTDHVVGGSV